GDGLRCVRVVADAWGIEDGYLDVHRVWHATPPDTTSALRAAMGATAGGSAPPAGRPLRIVRVGEAAPLGEPGELTLEDGTSLNVAGTLPPDVPIGYHDLRPRDRDGPVTRLIVTPGRCHLPAGLRAWVLTVQLPACRSAASW